MEKNRVITKPCYRQHILPYSWFFIISAEFLGKVYSNKPFARWHHFTTTTRILQGFANISCANLGFCYLNLTGITKFEYERKDETNSGLSSKKTS